MVGILVHEAIYRQGVLRNEKEHPNCIGGIGTHVRAGCNYRQAWSCTLRST